MNHLNHCVVPDVLGDLAAAMEACPPDPEDDHGGEIGDRGELEDPGEVMLI